MIVIITLQSHHLDQNYGINKQQKINTIRKVLKTKIQIMISKI